MATKTDICNQALGHIGLGPVENIRDGSPEGDACDRVYEQLLQEVLEEADWNFASKTVELAPQATAPPAAWSYRYGYPAGCLRPREVLTSVSLATDLPIAYILDVLDDDSAITILTNQQYAQLRYTGFQRTTALFSSLFIGCLSWRIAAEISGTLVKNQDVWSGATGQYELLKNRAMTKNANEIYKGPKRRPGATLARR